MTKFMETTGSINNSINKNVDTFLDPDAMIVRLNDLKTQAETVRKTIDKTKVIMDNLKIYFTGASAARLEKEYMDVAATFADFSKYLQEKIDAMQTLTSNIQRTDEG